MSEQRTLRVEDLFHRARGVALDLRSEWIARECAGDAALAAEVASLLAAGDDAREFVLHPQAPATRMLTVGAQVGRYRLVREIASGGMGVVFEAERADGEFERHVALKVIRGRFGSDVFGSAALDADLARRFLVERQHLAHLDHPHVAKLLDGGTTDDGAPYLVMELVAGEPIVDFCERRALALRPRLELFRKVCLAVQYVHSKLIAHRDLKPSNILVSDGPTGADEPAPKLLDFGIAKLLASDAAATATLGAQRLTPAYASPEQFKNEPITTASDVYSLGVILYELITGRLPHPTDGATPIVLARAVCEVSPPSPRSVRASVPAELDTIVLKALEKDPARRYASAAELADDLERFITGHPVLARPASRTYRARKLVARNKLAVGFASALALAIAGSSAWLAVLYARSLRAEGEAEQRRDIAERSNTLLRSLFDAPDPFAAHGKDVTVAEVLDDAAPRALAGLESQPQVRAEIAAVIGETYRKLGAYDKAEPYLRDVLATTRELRGDDESAVMTAAVSLGTLLAQRASWSEAETLLREAYELGERDLGPEHANTVTALSALGVTVRELNRLEEAETLSRLAVERARRVFGARASATWQSLNNLASLLHDLGRHAEAGVLFEEALAGMHESGADQLRFGLSLRYSYANNLYQRGLIDQAELTFRDVLESRRTLLGDEHPETLETAVWLGIVLTQRSGVAEAAELLEKALEAERRVFGPEHETTLGTAVEYGRTLYTQGRLEAAAEVLEPTYAALVRRFGCGHYMSLGAQAARATLAQLQGDWDGAIARQKELVEASEEGLGPQHGETLRSRTNLGVVLHQAGLLEEAAATTRETLDELRETFGSKDTLTLNSISNLASVLRELGRHDEALALFDELMQSASETMTPDNFQLAWFHYVHGRALDDAGKPERAEQEMARGFDDLMRTLGPAHDMTQRAGRYYADFLDRFDQGERANAVRETLEATNSPPRK